MREAGLEDVRWTGMTLGMVTVHVGTVPGSPAAAQREGSNAAVG